MWLKSIKLGVDDNNAGGSISIGNICSNNDFSSRKMLVVVTIAVIAVVTIAVVPPTVVLSKEHQASSSSISRVSIILGAFPACIAISKSL